MVDAYTKRILKRFGITVPRNYEELRLKLESIVSSNPVLYANYHGCIVNLAKEFCLTNPQCEKCPLTEHCPKLI